MEWDGGVDELRHMPYATHACFFEPRDSCGQVLLLHAVAQLSKQSAKFSTWG